MCPTATVRVAVVLILLGASWSAAGERPVAPGKGVANKLPPLPKGAVVVEVLGQLAWPNGDEPTPPGFQRVFGLPPTLVARANDELLKVWLADGKRKETPPLWLPPAANDDEAKAREVDFAKEMVVGVFWRQVTDRNQIKIERVSKQSGKVLVEFRHYSLERGGAKPRERDASHVVVLPKLTEIVEFRELPASITVDRRVIP